MRKFGQLRNYLIVVFMMPTLVACGGNRGTGNSNPTGAAAVKAEKNQWDEYVPKRREICRISQNPSWGKDIRIQYIAPVDGKKMYLMDARLERILIVDRAGKLLRGFLGKGQGPGEFQFVAKIQEFNNELWISEAHKLDRFSMDGELRDEFRFQHYYFGQTVVPGQRFTGVLEVLEGRNFDAKREKEAGLWNMKEKRLRLYRKSSKLGMVGIYLTNAYLALRFDGGIVPDLLMAADPVRKRVYICESDRYRIDVIALDGKPIRTIRRHPEPVRFTTRNKEETVESFSVSGVDRNAVKRKLMKQFPDFFYPISGIFVTSDGYLMVRRRIRPGHSGFDIFTPNGNYLVTWVDPDDLRLSDAVFFTHDRFAVLDDSGDLPVAVKYQVLPGRGK
ncbi:MAG: hypothetical protein GXO69_03415 [Acidobacteria bacterium]|nr:hypothetical protein [Acidobacteriota bacterium]